MLSKKYLHLCNADTWLCPWHRADYYFVTLCFQKNPYLFTKTNSNTVMSELISDDDQDSATDDFPPAAAVALAVCLTAVVVIVVVFVWRTRKTRRRPEAKKTSLCFRTTQTKDLNLPRACFSPRGSRRWKEEGKVLNQALLALRVLSLLLTHLQRPRKWEILKTRKLIIESSLPLHLRCIF